ncbi:hypothetical protein [Methanococcus sp. CF]
MSTNSLKIKEETENISKVEKYFKDFESWTQNMMFTSTILEFLAISLLVAYVFSKVIIGVGLEYKLFETMPFDVSFYLILIALWILNFIKYSKNSSPKQYLLYFSVLIAWLYSTLNIHNILISYFTYAIVCYFIIINIKNLAESIISGLFYFVLAFGYAILNIYVFLRIFLKILIKIVMFPLKVLETIYTNLTKKSKMDFSILKVSLKNIYDLIHGLKTKTNRSLYVTFLVIALLIARVTALFINLLSVSSIIGVFYIILNISFTLKNQASNSAISAIGSFTIFWAISEYKDKKIKQRVKNVSNGLKGSYDNEKINYYIKKIISESYLDYIEYYEIPNNLDLESESFDSAIEYIKELIKIIPPKPENIDKKPFYEYVMEHLEGEVSFYRLVSHLLYFNKDIKKLPNYELILGIIIYILKISMEIIDIGLNNKKDSKLFNDVQISFIKEFYNLWVYGLLEIAFLGVLSSPHSNMDTLEFKDIFTEGNITEKIKK